ncbi:VENN motif pre-toxin domain-containing protein [Achromobacter ruhlandii]|uniref:VENN motif pre-toxin domain-containing protein n=1 Tax=Achromobacter ruhlandii TaxID=72557 RepID=UPI0021F12D82|nr:VENN motif pre-toxin domain-containing protein [Achromobacter ruhlandii]MCV6805416.1 VENN motif pre-toxin domain-containing protein [Achromobacter ruhlandii]
MGSGTAPYLATEIKRRIGEDNPAANAMAHAVLGAVTAQLNGQSPLAGGLGAGGGELAARVIARQLFPGKGPDALSETEKQQISALSQLAAGIAGGLATGDAAGGVTGAQAGRNAVENNFLDVAELEDFVHRAKVGTGEERKKVIRDMVDTNNKPRLSREELKSAYVRRLIENAEKISTAKLGSQTTVPRDINEKILWRDVWSNPLQGRKLYGMNNDARFPEMAGFQKMEAKHKLSNGKIIIINYQYNSNAGKVYDMKITSPQPGLRDPRSVLDLKEK